METTKNTIAALSPYVDSCRKFSNGPATHRYTVVLDNSYTDLGWNDSELCEALIDFCDNGSANFGGTAFKGNNDGFATTFQVDVYVD